MRLAWRAGALAVLVSTGEASAQEAHELSLRVASYNVYDVPLISSDREARLDEIARRLSGLDIDVVALQELWVPEDAARMAEALAAAGLRHAHYFGPDADHERGSGLFVASRFPIDDVRFEAFRVGTTPYIPWHVDWMAEKGIGVVRLATPAGPVDVGNTHLHASYAMGDYGFVQLSQALQVADLLSATAAEMPPLLLMGDLNVAPTSLPLRALVSLSGLEPARSDFDLDHIFARGGSARRLRAEEVTTLFEEQVELEDGSESLLSDHPCLLARYALVTCGDCTSASATQPAAARPRWADLSATVVKALHAEVASTTRFMQLSRFGSLLPLAAAWLVWRLRAVRRLAIVTRISAAVAVVFGLWLGYVGWLFAPARLEEIAAQEASLAALQAPGP